MQITNNLLLIGISEASNGFRGGRPHLRPASDHIQISRFAARIPTSSERIAELQAAFRAGTYRASPDQIAKAMIDDALTN